jgi:hypothetical protein
MSGAIPVLLLYDFLLWVGTTIPVYLFHTIEFTLEKATNPQRGSRGIALLFL